MDANSALQQATGQSENVGALLQQEKTQLSPMVQNVQQTADQQVPKPNLQQSPAPPDQPNMAQSATEWMGVLSVLAGIGGAKSRQGATAALSSFTAGVKGFKQGKLDKLKETQEQWKDANAQVSENNKEQIELYTEALKDKKMSIDEQMAEIKVVASQYHNDIMAQLAEQRNYTAVARVVDMMQSNNDKLGLKVKEMQDRMDKLNEKLTGPEAASAVYGRIFPKDMSGVAHSPDGKPAPNFDTWYETVWPKLIKKAMSEKQEQGNLENDTSKLVPPVNEFDLSKKPAGGSNEPPALGGTVNVISPDGTPGTVPADKLDAALAAGFKRRGSNEPPALGGTVNVISPDGTPGTVPADKLDAALAAGFKRK